MKAPPLDLGQRVSGLVLDEYWWAQESRRRLALPFRSASGEVRVVWPYAPRIVGILTDAGETVTIEVDPVRGPDCADCAHPRHAPGDCLLGVGAGPCACGAAS